MDEITEIEQLERELQEKKARLQNKQATCNHEWADVKYDPEDVLVQYCTGNYVGGGVDTWPETAYRKEKKDRWSRTCKRCGKIEYGYKKELNKREFGRVLTLEELPGVTMHTITALLEKEFLEHIPRTINSPKGGVVVDYYRWTEQELE